MQINISGHHLDVSEAISSAVNKKMTKLSRQYPELETVKVFLTVEKNQQSAEVTTHFFGKDLSAKAKSNDLYASIAEMSDKLGALLERRKQLVKSHSHEKPVYEEESQDGEISENEDSDTASQ